MQSPWNSAKAIEEAVRLSGDINMETESTVSKPLQSVIIEGFLLENQQKRVKGNYLKKYAFFF